MIPSSWAFAPDAAKDAWRRWLRTTQIDNTSEAFVAGARWAMGQAGQGAVLREVEELKRTVYALRRGAAARSLPDQKTASQRGVLTSPTPPR